jgi:uncharacterized Zn finger protein (UPF0148 family)
LDKIEFLNSLGFTPISKDLDKKLEVKCKKGHIFKRAFSKFENGTTNCPICDKEEKVKFLNSLGFTSISEDLNHKLEVKCEKGHIFKRAFGTFKSGANSCPICEQEEKIKFLNNLGFISISKDLGTNLEVKCRKGHTFKRTFTNFKQGYTFCPICKEEGLEFVDDSYKKENKIEFLNSLGFTPISEDLGKKLEVKCEKGHIFKRPFDSFKNGVTNCPVCEKEEKLDFLSRLGFTPTSKNLVNDLEVKCEKGHIFKRAFSTFKHGSTNCPICDEEEKIEFLNNLGFTPVSKNLSSNLEVRCKKGHIFKRMFSNFKYGSTNCPICEIEEKIKFLNDLGFMSISENLSDHLEVKCLKCNNTFKRAFSDFKQGATKCPHCEREEKIRFLNSLGLTPVSENLGDYLEIKCEHGHIFKRTFDNLIKKGAYRCPICFPNSSSAELEVRDFLDDLGIEYIHSDWITIAPQELDFYIPSHNLAIEFDGIYWHSELRGKYKDYHLDKTEKCSKKGINLFHIFENEWINKKDIWKSIIKDNLGLNESIHANECIIKQVAKSEEEQFLEENHLQGYANSQVAFGLYYEDQLMCLMSFGKNKHSPDVEWELLRFANKQNINVVDGELKLFKYFSENFEGGIVSYSDRRYSNEDMYKALGFQFSHNNEPNCFYFKNFLVLENSQKYVKHKLPTLLETFNPSLTEWENMANNGYNRIWDCGSSVWKAI